MKPLLLIASLALLGSGADAGVLYQQAPNPAGGSYVTSWWDPDGSNYDQYRWDAFTLPANANLQAVEWRGTFGAAGAPIDFTVAIYASIPAGTQPDVGRPPLVEYTAGDNAGQTYAGTFGGVPMYDYAFPLPVAFAAQAGVKYWLQIEAWQSGFPDWAIAAGLGGDGSHFLCEHNNIVIDPGELAGGVPTGCWFTSRTGDAAFTLLGGAVGVDEGAGAAGIALAGVFPNPSRGERLDVTFRLPDGAPAQLALFDVIGRCVARVEVGTLGAGTHVVDLARRAPLGPGVYLVRLARAGQNALARVVVVP